LYAKTSATSRRDIACLTSLIACGNATQIEMILSVSRRPRGLRQVRKGRRYCCHYRAKLHQWEHDFIDKFSITILGCRISKSEPVTNVPYQDFKLFPVTKKVPSEYF